MKDFPFPPKERGDVSPIFIYIGDKDEDIYDPDALNFTSKNGCLRQFPDALREGGLHLMPADKTIHRDRDGCAHVQYKQRNDRNIFKELEQNFGCVLAVCIRENSVCVFRKRHNT